MTPAELAGVLDLLAQGLRMLSAGQPPPAPAVQQVLQQVAQAAPAPAPTAATNQRLLSDWLDAYEAEMNTRGHKAQTVRNRKALIDHCRRLWGHRPIAQIRPHEIATGLRSFPPSKSSTAVRVHSEIRAIFSEAIAADWCDYDPAGPLKRTKHRVKRARLTLEVWQAMRTLSKTSPQRWVQSMLLLAIVIGQRRGDLAKARFEDVITDDTGARFLRVEQEKEAGKGYGARVEIPLSLRLDAIGMTVGDVIEHCRTSAKPGPTLLRKAGGGAIEQSSLSARFHEHIVAVQPNAEYEMHEWPSLHECRSLAARTYLQQGLSMQTVQTLLGHAKVEMTELYAKDRGLSAKTWKRVAVNHPQGA